MSTTSRSKTANLRFLGDADGKTNVFKVKDMAFGVKGGGVALQFSGDFNNAPVTADVKTGASDLTASGTWPIDADLTYADYHLKAKGKANLGAKKADIASYDISAKKSELHGQLSASWGKGAHPSVKGNAAQRRIKPGGRFPAGRG